MVYAENITSTKIKKILINGCEFMLSRIILIVEDDKLVWDN